MRVNNSLFGGTENSGFGWWYMKVTQLPLQLHKVLEVIISVCNEAGCKTFNERISECLHTLGEFPGEDPVVMTNMLLFLLCTCCAHGMHTLIIVYR